jgi:hypothetical protein
VSGLATIFVADLLPILLIAGAGYLLARRGGVDVRTLSNVAFYILLPCLIFHMLVTSTLTGREVGQMALAAALITAAMAVVGAVAARLLGLARVESSAFLLVVMFSNGGNYGLPLVSFAFGPVALQFATVFFLTGAVLTFTIGGLLAAAGRRPAIDALRDVLKMPMVYAAVAALIVLSLGITISPILLRPVSLLRDAALPTMILILGMQVQRAVVPRRPVVSLTAVMVSLMIAPFVAIGVATALGITGEARQAVVILSSMPVAVSTTILAIQYDIDPEMVTSSVFLSTILSPLTLVPLIAWLS